jgi:hypothetical protein
MNNPYDARRATEEEKALVHGTADFVVTLGDKIVCHLQLLGIASLLANILNQEYAMWQQKENERIKELESALERIGKITLKETRMILNDSRATLVDITVYGEIAKLVTDTLKKAEEND